MNPIKKIADREFGNNEFKVGWKQGWKLFAGQTKAKDWKKHFKKAKEVFR